MFEIFLVVFYLFLFYIFYFSDIDNLIKRCNATEYGLAAGIFSNNISKAYIFLFFFLRIYDFYSEKLHYYFSFINRCFTNWKKSKIHIFFSAKYNKKNFRLLKIFIQFKFPFNQLIDLLVEMKKKNVLILVIHLFKVLHITRELKAGTVFVNTYQKTDVAAPFGGFKQSGFGKDLGKIFFEISVDTL